jgi:hypothetical protein
MTFAPARITLVAAILFAGLVTRTEGHAQTPSDLEPGRVGAVGPDHASASTLPTVQSAASTDPAQTIRALLGDTKTVGATASLGGPFAAYDRMFDKYFPMINAAKNANRLNNYYDRAVVYYARYARTGNAAFLRLAHEVVLQYRKGYLERNTYGLQPHNSQIRGLELHYRLTGDTMSRRAIAGVYAHSLSSYARKRHLANPKIDYMENRIQARVIQGALAAYRTGASYRRPDGLDFPASGWPAILRDALNQTLSTQQADGSYSWAQICGGQLNYMVGMLNDVLIEYYRDFEQDPRIPVAIEKANEYLWTTQWMPGAKAFKYASVGCSPNPFGANVGGPSPAGDLNGLLVASFGWLYHTTRDPKWRARGDAIFAGLVEPRWASAYRSTKQFNQAFSESYRYLGWR